MSRGPDAAALLERALLAHARAAGCAITVESGDWNRWASATFIGARHVLAVRGETSDLLRRWIAGLADIDLDLRGHLLADLQAASVSHRGGVTDLSIEALTLEQD